MIISAFTNEYHVFTHLEPPVKTSTIICMNLTLICKHKIYSAVSSKSPSNPMDSLFGINFFRVFNFFPTRLAGLLLEPSGHVLLFIKTHLVLPHRTCHTFFLLILLCFLSFNLRLACASQSLLHREPSGSDISWWWPCMSRGD